jgi:hypothetical protein
MKIKTDSENFMRDQRNSALLNTDVNAFKLYRQQRESQTAVSTVQEQVDGLKQDVSDIKEMLKILIKQNSKEN